VARIEPGEALKAQKRPHETKTKTKTKTKTRVGFVGAAAAAAHGGAVASAAEAHAATLAELGRWDEAVSASRRAVEVHEARVETHVTSASVGWPSFGLESALRSFATGNGDYGGSRTAVDFLAEGLSGAAAALAAALAAARGGAGEGAAPSETADAAAAGRENLRLQLAASRVKCADVMARAARSEGAAEDFRGERAAMLAGALAETQRAAETAAGRLAKLALDGGGDGGGDDARTVAASLRRRESAAAPGRHVAALVLFGRAARGALSLAAEEFGERKTKTRFEFFGTRGARDFGIRRRQSTGSSRSRTRSATWATPRSGSPRGRAPRRWWRWTRRTDARWRGSCRNAAPRWRRRARDFFFFFFAAAPSRSPSAPRDIYHRSLSIPHRSVRRTDRVRLRPKHDTTPAPAPRR
jgi:hypothetical protein